jgi:hypothetical protein
MMPPADAAVAQEITISRRTSASMPTYEKRTLALIDFDDSVVDANLERASMTLWPQALPLPPDFPKPTSQTDRRTDGR